MSIRTMVCLLMVILGCLLCVLGLRFAHFFYAFPAIPGILTVTFWTDTLLFALIAAVGAALMLAGIVRLVRATRRSAQ